MSFDWIRESPARWDEGKAAVIGGVPDGIFELDGYASGDLLPGEWWRAEQNGRVLGYGWMDCTWGDAEMLLAVDPGAGRRGVGTFILDRLEQEAAGRGLKYLYNTVRPTHPDAAGITSWLEARRFERGREDDRLTRRVR